MSLMDDIKTFVSQIHRRKLLKWAANQTILMLSTLLTVYLFWLIYNKIFFMTRLEWNFFPITLLFSLIPFFFGKPNISGTCEFLEKQIKELKGRLYLIMEPYPTASDSKTYTKRAIKECSSILQEKNIRRLTPIKSTRRRLFFLGSTILFLTVFSVSEGGIKLKRISETPIVIYSDEKIGENSVALVIAKSTELNRMYLFTQEGIEKMIYLDNGKFGIMAKIKKTSIVQVGYRTWKSDKIKLEVIPSLFVNKLVLKYQFPDYLGIKPFSDTLHEFEEGVSIQALSGTQIYFAGVSNVALGKIKGRINNESIRGRSFSGNFVLKEKEKISVNLTDTSLFSSYTLDFFIDPIKDEPPSIEFLSPREEYELGESMEVPVILEAEDDFGLSSISLHYGKEKTDLKMEVNTRFLEDSITLRIKNLLTGETLKITGIATDLAGNKTISPPLLIYMPTLEEILGEYRALSDTLGNYTSDVGEREKEIADKIESLLYKGDFGDKTEYDIKKTLKEQKDLIESMQKLSELMEEMRNPEVSREIGRIKELIDNPQIKDFLNELNKTMEKPDIPFEDLKNLNTAQKDLLKTLELFKKSLEYLKKLLELNEFLTRSEEIYNKQKEITSREADDSKSKLEKELSEKLESLIQDMEKSTDEEIQNIASEFRKTNTIEEMKNLARIMKRGEINEKTLRMVEENLRNLALSIKNTRESRLGDQITEYLKEKAWELGFILRTHNNIIDMNPGLKKGLIEQGLLEALDMIDRELQQIFLRSLSFSPDIFKDIRRAKEKLKVLSLEHTEREVPRSSMERVNDLLIQVILKLFSEPPPSSQNLANALRGIIEQQNSLMQGLGKMMPIPAPLLKENGKLKSLAERQRKLAGTLRKMGEAFGPLYSEMEKMAGDLESGKLDMKLLERQRKVLDRLLEAEKSIKEGEVSRRRHSEPGIFVTPEKVSLPKNLGEEKKNLRELLQRRINEPYPEEYKKEVEEYFKKLIE